MLFTRFVGDCCNQLGKIWLIKLIYCYTNNFVSADMQCDVVCFLFMLLLLVYLFFVLGRILALQGLVFYIPVPCARVSYSTMKPIVVLLVPMLLLSETGCVYG